MKATVRTQGMGGEYTHIWELRRPPCVVVDPRVAAENEGNALQEECGECAGCKEAHARQHGEVIPLKDASATSNPPPDMVTFKPSDLAPNKHVYQSPRSASARQKSDLPKGVLEHPFYFELDPKMPLPPIQEGSSNGPNNGTLTMKSSKGAGNETIKSTSSC